MTTSDLKPIQTIPAAEANRRFSELLRSVREEGRSYLVTSHGRAVARPTPAEPVDDEPFRQAAWEALRAPWRSIKGVAIAPWTRAEFYESGSGE